jgi:Lipocalin-like domain
MRCPLAVAAMFLAGCAQAPPVADGAPSVPLVGTWRLLNIVAIRPNGERIASRFGTKPTGYILYDRSGHMAVQIMASPWPAFVNPDKPTPQELEAVFNGYVAYAGTYDFDGATRTVTHHVQMSVDPGDLGKDFWRTVELEGDRVTLTVQQYPLNGEQGMLRLQWERVR